MTGDKTWVREAAVAGQFYPGIAGELDVVVSGFLADAETPGVAPPDTRNAPKAIIAPHAGYVYSGACAGEAPAAFAPAPRARRALSSCRAKTRSTKSQQSKRRRGKKGICPAGRCGPRRGSARSRRRTCAPAGGAAGPTHLRSPGRQGSRGPGPSRQVASASPTRGRWARRSARPAGPARARPRSAATRRDAGMRVRRANTQTKGHPQGRRRCQPRCSRRGRRGL